MPEFKELLPPSELPGAVEAGELLAKAASTGKRVVIYGDYDVDGITATTILWHGLRLSGADVRFYIPSRLEEGYGVNREAIDKLVDDGTSVLITVDCGITAVDEVRHARNRGMTVIITDHHEPRATLPDADAIVHPTATGTSANPHLSGAGVALKICWAMAQSLAGKSRVSDEFREFLIDATAFAALGLIADVVPLVGENRVIACYGLQHLGQSRNPGLRALIEVAGLADRERYDDFDVGFKLAPRLNAIGRLGHARLAVELFTRADPTRAAEIARMLNAENRRRQEVERTIVKQAEALVIERGYHRESCRGIVLASDEWHAGVIGIVAARLVERFCRPTMLIALENGHGQGSGRSVKHFPLHEVLETCSSHLLSHGGHAMAAGVRLAADRVEAFTEAFLAQAAQRLTPADLRPKLRLDDEISLGELSTQVVESIMRMAPFGEGNPRPLLASTEVELVDDPRVVGGGGRHVQLTVRQNGVYRKAIAFGRGDQAEEIGQHRRLRLAFRPIINEWNGRRRVELDVADWKPVENGQG